jgi:DNA polymerase theta
MRALTFEFEFRPVPQSLFIRCGALLQTPTRSFSRQISSDDILGMAQLCVEIMPSSTLVFCPSRLLACKYASQLGVAIANEVRELDMRYIYKPKVFPKDKLLLHSPTSLVRDCVQALPGSLLHARRLSLVSDLLACGVALTSAARAAIAIGVCFHHGGMGPDARRIVETALRERVVCVLCCTTALAAGVNFPARRVIIAAPMVGHEQLSHEKFTQMCGRAGRYGYDSIGEAVLFCSAENAALGWQLVTSGSRSNVQSVLGMGMHRFLLEMVCCFAACQDAAVSSAVRDTQCKEVSIDELITVTLTSFFACGLEAAATATTSLDNFVIEHLQKLQASGLVTLDQSRRCVQPTAEGSAVFISCISLPAAAQLHSDLGTVGVRCGRDELQLLHMLIPPISTLLPRFDWHVIHDNVWPSLDKGMIDTAAALHVEERCLYLLAYTKGAAVAAEDELRMRRFLCAYMLLEILGNSNVGAVAARFHLEIGAIHALQEAAVSHAACISEYAGVCRMWGMHAMCASAVRRMRSGGGTELHPLTEIRSCSAQRARALFVAGIKSPLHVVKAGESQVLDVLMRACGAQPRGIAAAIVQHAAFLIGQEVRLLQRRVLDLLVVPPQVKIS